MERINVKGNFHHDGIRTLTGDKTYKFYGNRVHSQYINRIQKAVGRGLAGVVSSLQEATPVKDQWNNYETYSPNGIMENLIRYCEIEKAKDSKEQIIAYSDRDGTVYGVCSQEHIFLPDKMVYEHAIKYLDAIGQPYEIMPEHNNYQMLLKISIPELAVEVAPGDNLGFMFIIGNSQFGHASLSLNAGILRWICTNGAYSMDKHISLSLEHRGSRTNSPRRMLDKFNKGFNRALASFDSTAGKVKEASEITEAWFDEEIGIEKWLPKKFNVRVTEAQEILRLMKSNSKYINTAFWVGQATAEYASNCGNFDRRIELEMIAGQMMFAQITV